VNVAPVILLVAAVLAGPPPHKWRPEAGPARGFGGIHVLLRTADGLATGHDLRYADGRFTLRGAGGGEASFAEGQVVQVQFLDLPFDELRDPLVRLAIHVAHLRRAPVLKRALLFRRLREGILLRPEEPLAATFRALVPRLWHPDLVAVLCAEAAHRGLLERKPGEVLALFEEAEAAEKARPEHAFAYGLMRAAALNDLGRDDDARAALRQLQQAYPNHAGDVARFRRFAGDVGDRRFPPFRPPRKGLGPRP